MLACVMYLKVSLDLGCYKAPIVPSAHARKQSLADLLLILGADKAAHLQKVFLADVRRVDEELRQRMDWLAFRNRLANAVFAGGA